MVLSQKSKMRPESYGGLQSNKVDQPFRPNPFPTGILAKNERKEYGDLCQEHIEEKLAEQT